MTNLATVGLLLLLPMILCGGLTIWRGYVCEPEPQRGSTYAFVAYCIYLLSVFLFFAMVFLVLVELATDGPDGFVSTCATVAATAATLGIALLSTDWAKTRRNELRLLARLDADDWWKSREHESPERIRLDVAALPPAPYPELMSFPPQATRAMYRAAWTRALILDEFTRRERVGRL